MRRTLALLVLVVCSLHAPPAAFAQEAPTSTPTLAEAQAALDAALADPRFDRWKRDRLLDSPDARIENSDLADRLRAWLEQRTEGLKRRVERLLRLALRPQPAAAVATPAMAGAG